MALSIKLAEIFVDDFKKKQFAKAENAKVILVRVPVELNLSTSFDFILVNSLNLSLCSYPPNTSSILFDVIEVKPILLFFLAIQRKSIQRFFLFSFFQWHPCWCCFFKLVIR
jgi:hypothetical protein